MSTREKELALTAEIEWLRDAVRTLGSELRAIEAELDDERINMTHTAAQVAAEMRDKINELHAQIEAMKRRGVCQEHSCDPWWILAARAGGKAGDNGTVVFPNQEAVRGFVKTLCEQARNDERERIAK